MPQLDRRCQRVYAAAQARLTDPTPSAPPDAAVVPEAVERWLRRLDGQQAGVAAYTAVIDQALRRKDYATPWAGLPRNPRSPVAGGSWVGQARPSPPLRLPVQPWPWEVLQHLCRGHLVPAEGALLVSGWPLRLESWEVALRPPSFGHLQLPPRLSRGN